VDVSLSDAAVAVLLLAAILSAAVSALGVLLSGNSYRRLHYMAPAATVGVWSVTAAVLIEEGLSLASIKAVLIATVVFFTNPVLSHATARAGRIEECGGLTLESEKTPPPAE
jgi:multicomponent Na+:H+ antiporter subunit G